MHCQRQMRLRCTYHDMLDILKTTDQKPDKDVDTVSYEDSMHFTWSFMLVGMKAIEATTGTCIHPTPFVLLFA